MSVLIPEILTIPEVAKYLHLSQSKVYYMVSRGDIPHLKIGRNVRIRKIDLDLWLSGQRVDHLATDHMGLWQDTFQGKIKQSQMDSGRGRKQSK